MTSKADAANPGFFRDKIIWFCYLMIATYCFVTASLGPLMAFLRAELDLSYAVAAYHFSGWSLGVVSAGFIGDKCMGRFGKRRTVWFSCLGFCTGVVVLIAAHNPLATIGSAFFCGFSGSIMSQTLLTIIADRSASFRAVAITEANIAASLYCSFAPILVGKLSQTVLGWRAALVLPIICFFAYFVWAAKSLYSIQEPEHKGKSLVSGRLPKAYWLCWLLIFLSVSCEWSIVFWSADFLEKIAKLPRPDAAACVTSFLAAMVTGRVLGSRLARELPSHTLLRSASIVALLGFLIFWLNNVPWLCVLGLFVTGLGISNFYPLTLSLAISKAAGLTSKASSRMALSSGAATLISPLLLGLVAGRCGIFAAYGLIAGLLFLGGVLIFLPVWQKD